MEQGNISLFIRGNIAMYLIQDDKVAVSRRSDPCLLPGTKPATCTPSRRQAAAHLSPSDLSSWYLHCTSNKEERHPRPSTHISQLLSAFSFAFRSLLTDV